jgi:hypothetical protein
MNDLRQQVKVPEKYDAALMQRLFDNMLSQIQMKIIGAEEMKVEDSKLYVKTNGVWKSTTLT